jgi:hypothetical protein
MKCIKAIKSSKALEIGTLDRVEDSIAELRVNTGFWQYIPKLEWKNSKQTTQSENKNQKIKKTKKQK